MNQENQQRRISFLAIHRDLMGNVAKNIEYKAHDELVDRAYKEVDALFTKYSWNGETKETITKTEDLPL